MSQTFHTLYVVLIIRALTTRVGCNKLNEGELLNQLLEGYNERVRPVRDASEQLIVELSLEYRQLLDLIWTDQYLRWNETETGVRRLVVPANLVWIPDLFITNLADEAKSTIEPLLGRKESAIVSPNGRILHILPFRVETTCKLDMADFPFDRQYCHIQIGSWSFDQEQLDIKRLEKAKITTYGGIDAPSSDWTIVRITDKLKSLKYESTIIVFKQHVLEVTVVLDRKSSATVAYTIVPCIMLEIIVAFSFLLPIRSGERISIGLTAFLAYSVYLLIIAEKLPEGSDILPNIAVTFLLFMGLSLVSIISSVITSRIDLEGSNYRAPPRCLLIFAHRLNSCSKPPDIRTLVSDTNTEGEKVTSNMSHDNTIDSLNTVVHEGIMEDADHSEEWNLIVKGIDKVLFIVVLLQLFISSGAFVARTVKQGD